MAYKLPIIHNLQPYDVVSIRWTSSDGFSGSTECAACIAGMQIEDLERHGYIIHDVTKA